MPAAQPELFFDAEAAEQQIEEHRKVVDYNIIEYPIEVIVAKYHGQAEDEEAPKAEFYVPDYQREHTWDQKRKSKFIESVLIGLPIPFLFLAETNDPEADGGLEIVDGSQRIRTLAEYLSSRLVLSDLEKLPTLNGTTFEVLPIARQRKFKRTTIRIIALTDDADEETRRDLFERINTGSDPLKDMEERRGTMRGIFINFIEECAANAVFHTLAPLAPSYVQRREREEFALRFFAYAEKYLEFDRSVREFLDSYVEAKNRGFDRDLFTREWESMLAFVHQHFPHGFRRANYTTAKRVRYEAISVGTILALRVNPSLVPSPTTDWSESEAFYDLTTSDSSNSAPKVKARIEFVRDRLLGVEQ